MRKIKQLFFIILLILLMAGCSSKENKKEINISAAASLKEVMFDIKEKYEKNNKDIKLVINYGSSGALKQQIEQGAPCDVFISAGEEQIDELDKEGLLHSDTIEEFTKNKLVLVSHKNSDLNNIESLVDSKYKNIAIGNIETVPAGKYANEVLESTKLKDKIKDKLVFGKDVKEVLSWVISDNADAGFVYLSDTVNQENLKIVENINKKYHSPIIYPVAITKSSKNYNESKSLEKYLLSDEVKEILSKYGYK